VLFDGDELYLGRTIGFGFEMGLRSVLVALFEKREGHESDLTDHKAHLQKETRLRWACDLCLLQDQFSDRFFKFRLKFSFKKL
jgi:hypothetical protein